MQPQSSTYTGVGLGLGLGLDVVFFLRPFVRFFFRKALSADMVAAVWRQDRREGTWEGGSEAVSCHKPCAVGLTQLHTHFQSDPVRDIPLCLCPSQLDTRGEKVAVAVAVAGQVCCTVTHAHHRWLVLRLTSTCTYHHLVKIRTGRFQ